MSLASGTRLGPYEITALLGAGGMGEVYRARDQKLGRDVALKILPEQFASDPERLARFEREAKMLAALNHPHIAHIHGFEESGGTCALVMELVEGEDLAQRVTRGPIPLDEALPIARQIAEALEAAHEQGIIHRDLKPANIKVRADGTVKVLDFGLAKALDPIGVSSADATISPTFSIHATQAGVILGTAAYMAPEQARGKVVDKRADIWAFGCVLFEMLASTRAFMGDDVTDTIVAVVSKEPDWQTLPAAASGVRPLIARCLKKDPKQRLQAIGDARIEIEELIAAPSAQIDTAHSPPPIGWRHLALPATAALAAGAVVGALVTWTLTHAAPQSPLSPSRFQIQPTQGLAAESLDRDVVISPDGRNIAYRGAAPAAAQLFLRPIDRLDAVALGTVSRIGPIFFSPDGRWIGFFDTRSIRKIPITGGSAITVCQIAGQPRGATWGDDDTIVFTTTDPAVGLLRVPANGGEPTVLTTPAKGESNHWHPSMLPQGRGVLFSIAAPNQGEQAQVAVLDFRTGQQKTLIRGGSQAEYVQSGHLLYAAAGTLRAVRFDLERLEVMSDPVSVIDDVWMAPNGAARYSVSRGGTLVYAAAGAARTPRSLVWVDRKGNETLIGAPPRLYSEPRLSPDGTRLVIVARDEEHDLWIWDFRRQTLTRVTFGPAEEQSPTWTLDGRRIVFGWREGNSYGVFSQAADGTGGAERLTSSGDLRAPSFVAPDGSGLVGSEVHPKTRGDIVWIPLKTPAARESDPGSRSDVKPLVSTPFVEFNPEISPDGRYLTYQSEESGRFEIYVRPFPRVDDGRWQISTAGGTRPMWSRDGRELFYMDLTYRLTAVDVQTSEPTFSSGNPVTILATRYATPLEAFRNYDVSPDGHRFLMIKEVAAADRHTSRTGIVVATNWFEELTAKLPAGR